MPVAASSDDLSLLTTPAYSASGSTTTQPTTLGQVVDQSA